MLIRFKNKWVKWLFTAVACLPLTTLAQTQSTVVKSAPNETGIIFLLVIVLLTILAAALFLSFEV